MWLIKSYPKPKERNPNDQQKMAWGERIVSPKPFSISVSEAKWLMMENNLEQWARDQFASQGITKHVYLIMHHNKETDLITFYPVQTTWWWRLKAKVLDLFGIHYLVRLIK